MPDRLARTSAFTPRRQGLITDSNFVRVYEVPGYSVVEVKGRELGSQHRDAIYALFRLPRAKVTVPNPEYRRGTLLSPTKTHYETRTTWRELLRAIGKIEHLNNLLTMMQVLAEIRQVNFIVHQGKSLKDIERIHSARAGTSSLTALAAFLGSSRISNGTAGTLTARSWCSSAPRCCK